MNYGNRSAIHAKYQKETTWKTSQSETNSELENKEVSARTMYVTLVCTEIKCQRSNTQTVSRVQCTSHHLKHSQ